MSYTVKTTADAWKIANSIFPTDYEYDADLSRRAGYPVYPSTHPDYRFAKINDLNVRLEVVLEDYTCINIWIEDEPETVDPETVDPETVDPETVDPETVDPETVDPEISALIAAVVVMVTPAKDPDAAPARFYSIPELLEQTRFFWSGGRPYDHFEGRLDAARRAMEITIDDLGFSETVSFVHSGLRFSVMNGRRADYFKSYHE